MIARVCSAELSNYERAYIVMRYCGVHLLFDTCGTQTRSADLILEILDLAVVVVHVVVAAQQLLADGPVVVAGVLVRTPRLGGRQDAQREEEEETGW